MKKAALIVALLIVLILPTPAHAATARAVQVFPSLSFNGKAAECSVTIWGEYAKDEITVVVKLWKESSCIETWNDSGEGYVNFSVTKTVSGSGQYKLTVDAAINGTKLPIASTTAYCR